MKDFTDITILLDRSGSMASVHSSVIEGLNSFLSSQKSLPGEASVSLIQFDDKYEVNYTALPLNSAPNLSAETYAPRGGTALYDALCRSIDETGSRLAEMPEKDRPSRVQFIIQTDGFENASVKNTAESVKARVQKQTNEYNWKFVFLGANQDAILSAEAMGIARGSAMTYTADAASTRQLFTSVSNMTARYRSADVDDANCVGFTDEERKEVVSK